MESSMETEKNMSKRDIRKSVLARRDAMADEERKRAALLMTERILGHQWFYRCENFLCFVSYGSEIDTWELIREALRMGKRTFVPKVEGTSAMEFYRISSLEELEAGYKGIPEPARSLEKFFFTPELAEKTFMLMPGAAFDAYGCRLGYGKGFYDRYLADKEELQLHTVAVGFQCQLVDRLPVEETDIRPYQVICV